MNALQGLSAVAAEMPRASEAAAAMKIKGGGGQNEKPHQQVVAGSDDIEQQQPRRASSTLPLRKRPFDVDAGGLSGPPHHLAEAASPSQLAATARVLDYSRRLLQLGGGVVGRQQHHPHAPSFLLNGICPPIPVGYPVANPAVHPHLDPLVQELEARAFLSAGPGGGWFANTAASHRQFQMVQQQQQQDMLYQQDRIRQQFGLPPSSRGGEMTPQGAMDVHAEYNYAKVRIAADEGQAPFMNVSYSRNESTNDLVAQGEQQNTSDTAAKTQEEEDDDEDDEEFANDNNSITLFLPSDNGFLTEAHSFLRSVCIELFMSTEENVRAPGKGARPQRAGQVGFRCIHCRGVPKYQQANQAVCYPSKRENIFESVRNFQRVHLNACPYTADEIKVRYREIVKRGDGPKRSQRLVRAYYAQAAAEVGLVDTPHGLEYRAKRRRDGNNGPSEEMLLIMRAAREEEESAASGGKLQPSSLVLGKRSSCGGDDSTADSDIKYGKFETIATDETKRVLQSAQEEITPFVIPEDFPTISDYVYLLFHQLLPCKPTTATIKRRRLNIGQFQRIPGLCCRFCHKNDGINGMYFPVSVDSLGDSSFSQTLMMHVSTCSFVPREIKNALCELKALAKEHNACVKRGAKKTFTEKVWKRMEEIAKNNRGIIVGEESR